jgi:spore maturation protein CgeD
MDYGKVSIILTVYNKPQYLRECIDSVLAQTYQNWELLIMEDNSPGAEVKSIIRGYLRDPRIRAYWSTISEEERYKTARYATLINIAGFEMATGDYYTYLTDDDFFYPHRLERMVEELQKPGIDVVYGPQQTVDANGGKGSVRETKGILGPSTKTEGFNNIDHNSVMHRAHIFHEVNGWYDVPGVWGGADAYFWRRINEKGYDFHPIDDVPPMDAKRYHDKNVQALIVRGEFFPDGKTPW